MLAKIWKKALLAICIIACLYNVMHKLVSRTSLEIQLKNVQNQSSLLDIWKDNKIENQEKDTEKENFFNQKETNLENENSNLAEEKDNVVVIID